MKLLSHGLGLRRECEGILELATSDEEPRAGLLSQARNPFMIVASVLVCAFVGLLLLDVYSEFSRTGIRTTIQSG